MAIPKVPSFVERATHHGMGWCSASSSSSSFTSSDDDDDDGDADDENVLDTTPSSCESGTETRRHKNKRRDGKTTLASKRVDAKTTKTTATTTTTTTTRIESLTDELIASLRPSKQSEKRRRLVFEKMERFVRECFCAAASSQRRNNKESSGGEQHNHHHRTPPPIVVSAFGSVPFGTYLPDGDIDMCVLGDHDVLDSQSWPETLSAFIARKEREEKESKKKKMHTSTRTNTNDNNNNDNNNDDDDDKVEKNKEKEQKNDEETDEYHPLEVKDIVVIHADVRLLKCVVDGIVVDVSANQFGGLATLAFLEEVNAKIGKNDLFKRSVILIKAWALYESRILGAPYALLSTYALKTLIICALRRNATDDDDDDEQGKRKKKPIETPLDVLRIFFEFVSNFPWETHAVTIFGDVPVEKLDKASVRDFCRGPKNYSRSDDDNDNDDDLLGVLDDNFVDTMLKRYGPDSRPDAHVLLHGPNGKKVPFRRRAIGAKHLHILDPLSETNNLGRSVSLGNFARIRAAFRLGAERLKRLEMESDPENLTKGFEYFFKVALANRGGKLASCVGEENEKFIIGPSTPTTNAPTNTSHVKKTSSLGSSSPFRHSHSVADDLVALKSPREPSPSQKENIPNEDDEEEEEKIRLMLDDFEEKDAHGERGLFWGRWDGPIKPNALPRALSSAEARVEIENAHKAKFSSSSDESMSPPSSDASSPVISPPRSEIGDSTTDSAEYPGDDARSMTSMGSDSNTTTSSNGSMPPNSPLSPLDKYMPMFKNKNSSSGGASIPPPIEESKDIITGCLETIHNHLNFGIEMQRLAIERQNAALNNAMMMNKRTIIAPPLPPPTPPPLPSSPPQSGTAFVSLVPSMPPLPPPLPPQPIPSPITAVKAPSVVVPSPVNVSTSQAKKLSLMNVRPKPNPIPSTTTSTTTKTIPTVRMPSMNWKVACGNSTNSTSATNAPTPKKTTTTTTITTKADSVVDAKVISAKLSEQEQDVELESLKSSNETIVAAEGNNDDDDDETGNVSMVETVAWVHVARGGAARQAQSSVDDVDVQKEQTSTPEPEEKKASKKTGKSWGKKTKKIQSKEAATEVFVNNDLRCERVEEIDREMSKGHSPARCKSVPLQPSWGPKGTVCLDTLRKVAEKKTTSKKTTVSPPNSVLSEDGGVIFDESDVQIAFEAARVSLKGVWADVDAPAQQKSKSANSSPRNKKKIVPALETSCEKSFPKFGSTTTTATTPSTSATTRGPAAQRNTHWASIL